MPLPRSMGEDGECDGLFGIGVDAEFRRRGDAAGGQECFDLHHELTIVNAAARYDDFFRAGREVVDADSDACRR